MFGDPYNNDLERWEIAERIAEKEARNAGKVPFWRRPKVIAMGVLGVFAAAGIRGLSVDKSVVPASRLSVQTAGFDGGGFVKAGAFGTLHREGENAKFSKLVLRTPDAAAWPQLDRARREEGRALVREMLREPFDGDWEFLSRNLRGGLDQAGAQAADWNDISLHWSHTRSGNARMLRAYHQGVRGLAGGMAYHFVIGNGSGAGNGEITIGERWENGISSGAPVSPESVSICLIGDGDPTDAQAAALRELVIYLEAKVGELITR